MILLFRLDSGMKHRLSCIYLCGLLVGLANDASRAQYEPPAGYYDSATGTGATLKDQLETIMTSGHVQQSYGEYRFASVNYDTDPNIPGNILLVYNRQSVSATWDSGVTWNREHVWPQSRQPGSANNSSIGNLGDPYALRPANPAVNTARSNKPYGNFTSTGAYGAVASGYYFPGDADKGDIARSLFYSATRYQSTLSLIIGFPSGDQMGDLRSLLRWHFTDPPDDFEWRRNHMIFGDTNNRNAYVDRPEFLWSVFGGGANNSRLYVGGSPPADGDSAVILDLGRIIFGEALPAAQSVTLNKDGADPTYYSVTAAGEATSDVTGGFNAFDFNSQTNSLTIGLSGSTAAVGLKSGTVTVDNLDVDGGAAGQGSNDGDDVITVELAVVDHAEASFDPILDQDLLTIDFGSVEGGIGVQVVGFDLHNLESMSGFTAELDLLSVNGTGDTAVLFTDLVPFAGLAPGSAQPFEASIDTSTAGTYSADYTLSVSDENIPGALAGTPLILTLTGIVLDPCDGCDVNCDGMRTTDDIAAFVALVVDGAVPCAPCAGNANADAATDGGDVQALVDCLLAGP